MPACGAAETERLFQHQPTVKVSAGISVGLLDLSLIPHKHLQMSAGHVDGWLGIIQAEIYGGTLSFGSDRVNIN